MTDKLKHTIFAVPSCRLKQKEREHINRAIKFIKQSQKQFAFRITHAKTEELADALRHESTNKLTTN